jgi:hypothetical protein
MESRGEVKERICVACNSQPKNPNPVHGAKKRVIEPEQPLKPTRQHDDGTKNPAQKRRLDFTESIQRVAIEIDRLTMDFTTFQACKILELCQIIEKLQALERNENPIMDISEI